MSSITIMARGLSGSRNLRQRYSTWRTPFGTRTQAKLGLFLGSSSASMIKPLAKFSVRIGLQLLLISAVKKDHLQKLRNTVLCMCRYRYKYRSCCPSLPEQSSYSDNSCLLCRCCTRLIDLIDCHTPTPAAFCMVVDRFHGLRHAVVRRDFTRIADISWTERLPHTHGRKCLVAWCVWVIAIFFTVNFHHVVPICCADVAGLPLEVIVLSHESHKKGGGFTVVNVAHKWLPCRRSMQPCR